MSAFEADRFNHSRTSPRKKHQFLATASKKLLQNSCATSRQHSAAYINPVVELWMIQQLHHRPHGPGFRVVCAVNQAPDARMHHRTGAHSARLNCNKQVAVRQAMVTDGCSGLAQRNNFGVSRGIMLADITVPSTPDNLLPQYHHGSNRNFASFEGALRGTQSLLHPEFV